MLFISVKKVTSFMFDRTINMPLTAQKMKLSIKDFFSKCDQIRCFLLIWSHLLKKSLMENFIFLCSACYLISAVLLQSLFELLLALFFEETLNMVPISLLWFSWQVFV